jgi:hypothetical protein
MFLISRGSSFSFWEFLSIALLLALAMDTYSTSQMMNHATAIANEFNSRIDNIKESATQIIESSMPEEKKAERLRTLTSNVELLADFRDSIFE